MKKWKIAQSLFWSNIFAVSDESAKKVSLLKKNPLFKELSAWEFGVVSEMFYLRSYENNEFLFEIDQPGAAFFIIEDGEVSVELPDLNNASTELAVLKDGDFLGELALLDQSPRSASARALRKTRALALFRTDLVNLMQTHPAIASKIYMALARIVGDRLKATNRLLQSGERSAA